MDNITNIVQFVERLETHPRNDSEQLTPSEIREILTHEEYNRTFNEIHTLYPHINSSNFRSLIKDTFIIKNDEAIEYLKHCEWGSSYDIIKNQTLIPQDGINYYVINYYDTLNINHFIIVLEINLKYVTSYFYENFKITENKYNSMFFVVLRNFMFFHFEEINNIKNETDERATIMSTIKNTNVDYHSQKMITQPDFLKHQLYQYQKADLYWMLNREQNQKKIILDCDIVVNWGPHMEFDFKTETFREKTTIHNYSKPFNYFCGGCLCNEAGLGKTLEIYTLCGMEPSLNLIIVPNHLHDHWIYEYTKHINPDAIDLISYNESCDITYTGTKSLIILSSLENVDSKLMNYPFTRLIIDEFHELFDKRNTKCEMILNINANYKWAVTATPILEPPMICNVLNFVIKNKIVSESDDKSKSTIDLKKISKCKKYLDTFVDMFRQNTTSSVNMETKIPTITEDIYYAPFSSREKTYYDVLPNNSTSEEYKIRQLSFCIHPLMNIMDKLGSLEQFKHVSSLDGIIKNMFTEEYHDELLKLIIFIKKLLIKCLDYKGTDTQKINNLNNQEIGVICDYYVLNKTKILSLDEKMIILKFNHNNLIEHRKSFNIYDIIYNYYVNDTCDTMSLKKMLLEKTYNNKIKLDDEIMVISSLEDDDIETCWDFFINDENALIKNKKILLSKYYNNKITIDDEELVIDDMTKDQLETIWLLYIDEQVMHIKKPVFNDIRDEIQNISKMKNNLVTFKSKMNFFDQEIEKLNKKSKKKLITHESTESIEYTEVNLSEPTEETPCSICYESLEEDCSLLQCGHSYHTHCIKMLIDNGHQKCPQCKMNLKNTTIYIPKEIKHKSSSGIDDMIDKYGTKISHLINIIKKRSESDKIVLYCESPSLISNVVSILNENGISTITPTTNIFETIHLFETRYKVLVLSSDFNASGLNIQFANVVIILQPIRGDYARRKQIEHQIVGRLHRIGQMKEIKFIRLIIKNSIESDIEKENFLMDINYERKNKKVEYIDSVKSIIEC